MANPKITETCQNRLGFSNGASWNKPISAAMSNKPKTVCDSGIAPLGPTAFGRLPVIMAGTKFFFSRQK